MKDKKQNVRELVVSLLFLTGLVLIGWALYLVNLVALLVYLGLVCVLWAVCVALADEKGGEKE